MTQLPSFAPSVVGGGDEVARALYRHLQLLDLAEIARQPRPALRAAPIITFIRAEAGMGSG